jgi:cysteine desulfuration protein SufE
MTDHPPTSVDQTPAIPPAIEQVLQRFRVLGREEKMQALVAYARRLEPVPERFLALEDDSFRVPECQTPVRIFPEVRDGRMHYYAAVDVRRSPTVAAFLGILFSAVNDQPPPVALAIPADFVRTVMESLGLGTREVGLDALVARVKRLARLALDGASSTL